MPTPGEVEVSHFIKKNETFFRAPFDNQEEFVKFYETQGQLDDIKDYSQKFMKVLQKTLHQEGNYVGPAIVWWQQGDFEKVLKEPEIREFIMDNQDHPALLAWQRQHPLADIPAPPAFSEEEIDWMKQFVTELTQELETAKKELTTHINQLQNMPDKNEQTNSNIKHLSDARIKINQSLATLKSTEMELSGNFGRPIPSQIISNLNLVQKKLTVEIKGELLKVKDPHIKGWCERFLDSFLKFCGSVDGYKSHATIQAEKRSESVHQLSEQFPETMQKVALNVNKTREAKDTLNQIKGAGEETNEEIEISIQSSQPGSSQGA